MADINVTRKGPTIWPWILGLLLLALLIWALTEFIGADEPEVLIEEPRAAVVGEEPLPAFRIAAASTNGAVV